MARGRKTSLAGRSRDLREHVIEGLTEPGLRLPADLLPTGRSEPPDEKRKLRLKFRETLDTGDPGDALDLGRCRGIDCRRARGVRDSAWWVRYELY